MSDRERKVVMRSQIFETLGDYSEFYRLQSERLQALGIAIDGLEVSHLAFRTETLEDYLVIRQKLETVCSANVENLWNGRPISKLLLREPLQISPSATTSLIELIPPIHQRIYKMGLEHVGLVVGESFDEFGKLHGGKFTGQQDQGEFFQPYFITFPDHTNVKFYRYSLQSVCVREGRKFDAFHYAAT